MKTTRIRSSHLVEGSKFLFSRAVRAGDHVVVAGTEPSWPDGDWNLEPQAQAARCLEVIIEALKEVGAGPEDITRTWVWLRHAGVAEAVGRAHAAVLGRVQPATTQVVASGFQDPRSLVMIEVEAVVGGQRQAVSISSYATDAVLGASRAYRIGNRVHVSSTAPIGASDLDVSYDPDPEAQFDRCIVLIEEALRAAGTDLDHVTATRTWLRDQRDAGPTGRAHHKVFGEAKPAFTQLTLPSLRNPHARVEIEVEADSSADRQNSNYNNAADSPWSRGVRVGNRILVTTTGPRWEDGSIDPDPGAQAQRVWEIILASLKETGAEPEDVVRARIYLRHQGDFDAVAKFTHQAFAGSMPAVSVMAIQGFNNPQWRVEIEAEAAI